MKARLVIAGFNAGMAANVGGEVERTVRTFEIDIPEEAAKMLESGTYYHGNVIGLELMPAQEPA